MNGYEMELFDIYNGEDDLHDDSYILDYKRKESEELALMIMEELGLQD